MEPVVTNAFEENQNDWLNKALNERSANLDRFVYFTTDTDKLKEHKADVKRIAEAVERTKKYLKE
jgi:outer membrane protein OmpA-like peptidoglycan-associated protein